MELCNGSVETTRAPAYTNPDGTLDSDAIYRANFYNDMVSGVDKMVSTGAIVSSPIVVGNVVYVGSADGTACGKRKAMSQYEVPAKIACDTPQILPPN